MERQGAATDFMTPRPIHGVRHDYVKLDLPHAGFV
ncbi:hypothetical protein X739_07055 [Mesorhizobium sp. LNHC220B00]|nr:hypothetical protein X739_07055 [Mesorhizobium sp. LNHC220B00]